MQPPEDFSSGGAQWYLVTHVLRLIWIISFDIISRCDPVIATSVRPASAFSASYMTRQNKNLIASWQHILSVCAVRRPFQSRGWAETGITQLLFIQEQQPVWRSGHSPQPPVTTRAVKQRGRRQQAPPARRPRCRWSVWWERLRTELAAGGAEEQPEPTPVCLPKTRTTQHDCSAPFFLCNFTDWHANKCRVLPVPSSSERCSSTAGGGAGAGIPFLPPASASVCPKFTKLAYRRWPVAGFK